MAQFYDIRSKIWGGSPAAESIAGAIDTGEAPCSSGADEPGTSSDKCNKTQTNLNAKEYGCAEDENLSDPDVSPPLKRKAAVVHETPRCDLITHLKEKRNKKLHKPLPYEKQMVEIARQDLALKKELMTQLNDINKEQSNQMKLLTNTLVNLTNTLASALQLTQQKFVQQGAVYQSPHVQRSTTDNKLMILNPIILNSELFNSLDFLRYRKLLNMIDIS